MTSYVNVVTCVLIEIFALERSLPSLSWVDENPNMRLLSAAL
ncbi:hypothetical protein [Coleofasciculus sp. FACHB-712]|nr:hypothetical protein [Coleofasciculus sp. FACHB-712]